MAIAQLAQTRIDGLHASTRLDEAEFAPLRERAEVIQFRGVQQEAAPKAASFTQLEWTVIGLARRDGLASIRRPGLAQRVPALLFGRQVARRLADDRLETLRRVSVVAWRFGRSMPSAAHAALAAAGYGIGHLDLLVDFVSIGAQRPRALAKRVADVIAAATLRRVEFGATARGDRLG